ncbi:hypothetical protein F0562_002025 [Nyssa sinensis]|uniref:Disease resistance N-terminal domain-containing protein n=1 Tax=Nyssa sinensis TaxID=561372 RepID=A0A5J5C9S5_9ASTE|nr:hypothetical protein F0562_002025 [Nyssa sinensis]
MANAILNVVLKKLSSLIEKEIGLLWGVEKEMEKLSSTLSTIQAVLEDAEQRQPQDKVLQDWLRKLKHTAYVADDILDECATHAIPLESKEHNSGLLGKLSDCINCLQLPPFGQLPSLRDLQISGMIFLEYIDSDSRGSAATGGFPSLEVLNISELPSLKGLFKDDEPELFPRLRIMNINNCPKLMLPCLPSIEHLLIERCSELLLSSISNLSALISLYVDQCEEVVYLSEEMLRKLTVLESLTIENFPKLKGLPTTLANLTSLKLLHLSNCHELESLPEQALRGLHSLRRLVINGCNNVKSLYTGLQHLTGLESLGIGGLVHIGTFQTTRSLTGDVSGNDEAVSFTEEMLHRISFLAANRNVYQA